MNKYSIAVTKGIGEEERDSVHKIEKIEKVEKHISGGRSKEDRMRVGELVEILGRSHLQCLEKDMNNIDYFSDLTQHSREEPGGQGDKKESINNKNVEKVGAKRLKPIIHQYSSNLSKVKPGLLTPNSFSTHGSPKAVIIYIYIYIL